MKLGKRRLTAAALGLVPAIYFSYNWNAFRQDSSQVAVRGPGERQLRAPEAVSSQASRHLDFAYLSEAAYDPVYGTPPVQAEVVGDGACRPPAEALRGLGWRRWEFPPPELRDRIEHLHLRVHVWERESPPAVAVAFGGTLFTNREDWRANLRWFIPRHEDQYTEIVETVGPLFVHELHRRREQADGAFLRGATLYATGHSLGGGLAQQFAYALPMDAGTPVSEVYAFDPSPVTGFYSVSPEVRDHNRRRLTIVRIYERGEILAALRLALGLFYPPSNEAPGIWNVRYDLVERMNPLAGHSIADLACGLYRIGGSAARAAAAPRSWTDAR